MTQAVPIRAMQADDLPAVAPLFDAYRQFYGRAPDLPSALQYLAQRLHAGDAQVFVALGGDGAVQAFTLLYPSWCSLELRPILILHDLFVRPEARGQGIARRLMQHTRDYAIARGAQRLVLNTARDNRAAQALYESLDYVRETVFVEYALRLP